MFAGPISALTFFIFASVMALSIAVMGIILSSQMKKIDILLEHKKPKKKRKPSRKPILSDDDVEHIQIMLNEGYTKTEVAKHYNVSRQTLYTALERMKI